MDLQCFLKAVVLKGRGCKAKLVAFQRAGEPGCEKPAGEGDGQRMDLQCFLMAVVLKRLGCKAELVAFQRAGEPACEDAAGQADGQSMDLQCFLMAVVMNESEQIRKLRLNLSGS